MIKTEYPSPTQAAARRQRLLLRPMRGRLVRDMRRGVTLVEFALVFPLLMATLIAVIELVRMGGIRHAADNAAYEAARHVIVPGATVAEGTAEARDLLARGGVNHATIIVSPSPITEETEFVTVRVDVPLAQNSWLPPALTGNKTISRRTTLMTDRGVVNTSSGGSDSDWHGDGDHHD